MKFKCILLYIEIIFYFINVIHGSAGTQGLYESYLIHLYYTYDNGEKVYVPEFKENNNSSVKTNTFIYKILPNIESNGNVKMTEN